MTFVQQFIRRPQQLWVRKALFQIHLWLGIFLALYLIAVGLTGSILVFKEEAVASLVPQMKPPPADNQSRAPLATVVDKLKAAYPDFRIAVLYLPSPAIPEYQAIAMGRVDGRPSKFMLSSNPVTGEVVGDVNLTSSWLGFVHSLHISLLSGPPGFIANGIGAALLIVATFSGLVLWWPGIRSWKRGFLVDFRKNWKRINWDMHNTLGFYTLGIVFFWALSTIYFVIPDQFTAFVNEFSRVTIEGPDAARSTKIRVPAGAHGKPIPADDLLDRAKAISPDARPIAVSLPANPSMPFVVFMLRGDHAIDTAEMPDEAVRVYFDPYDGHRLASEAPPENRTIGDWIIWSMVPVHFGTKWGMTVKIIWALVGLSIPILAVTGLLMYWNRYLSKKWSKLRSRRLPPSAEPHAVMKAALIVMFAMGTASAQPAIGNCNAASNVLQRAVHSGDGKREYRVYISKPTQPAPDQGYPVMYALDGNAVFDALARNSIAASEPLLIVGIGYNTPLCYSTDARALDYTPPMDNGEPVMDSARGARPAGGAKEFLAFVRDELRPSIEKEFSVNKARQSLYGHSYGGLFVLYTLFTAPELFGSYIAASPSVWWHDNFILSKARPSAGKRILLLEGELEVRQAATRSRGNAPDALPNLAGKLGVEYVLMPGKNHPQMLPASLEPAVSLAIKQ